LRGNQETATPVVIVQIRRGPGLLYQFVSIALGAEQESAALVRIVSRSVRVDLLQFRLRQGDTHERSSQKCSLKYLSALSGKMVTITPFSPRAFSVSATLIQAASAAPLDTPTKMPSSRARCFTMR